MRAPFNIAVAVYRIVDSEPEFLVLERFDQKYWQLIAGGGEDDEAPLEAARREALEEAGISLTCELSQLDTLITVPAIEFKEHISWPASTFVIPQYYFSADGGLADIKLSDEHLNFRWLRFEKAVSILKWESDKIALYELNARLALSD